MSVPLKFFPLGTSRLHWAISYISRHNGADVTFPNFGYFQSAGQIRTVLEILSGATEIPDICHYIFRKDAFPGNPFNERALTNDHDFWLQKRTQFATADVLLIELSSPVEFILGNLHVQGNPNYRKEVPFTEVWKTGYYKIYEPDIDVERRAFTQAELAKTMEDCGKLTGGRPVVVQSHIYQAGQDHGRATFATQVAAQSKALGWSFVDAAALCETHGYRILQSGQTDIHHLSWPGTRTNAVRILEAGLSAVGNSLSPAMREAILEDQSEPI